eukprot:5103181-Prymnesium_polylepis.1
MEKFEDGGRACGMTRGRARRSLLTAPSMIGKFFSRCLETVSRVATFSLRALDLSPASHGEEAPRGGGR